jgi:hypothetical protein
MRNVRAGRVGLAVAAVAVIGVGTIGAATSGAAATFTAHEASCSGFTGPSWSFPEFGKTGTRWKVTTSKGVGCGFATRWAKTLLHTPYKGEAATKLKGPKGWKCLPSIPHGGGVPGECRQAKKHFSWGPDVHF